VARGCSRERGAAYPLALHTRVESIPALADASPAQAQGGGDLTDLYRLRLQGKGARGIVRVIEAVATVDWSVLVHCAASKDRTGVSVALMLTPIGIDRAEVVTDDVATVAITGGKR